MAGTAARTRSGSNAVTVFAPISHPVLRTVDPSKVAKFMRERAQYELEVEEKQKEVPTLTKANYKLSIDPSLLSTMFSLGRFDTIAPEVTNSDDLTEEHIKTFIEKLIKKQDKEFDLKVVDQALSGLSMNMDITDPKARMYQLAYDVFERLESVGYGTFRTSNPKKTVRIICGRLRPPQLKSVMERRLEYDEKLEKDVKGFIHIACHEAVSCQTYVTTKKPTDSNGSASDTTTSTTDETNNKKRKTPLCLYTSCREKGKRHFLCDCKDCPENETWALLKANREKKEKEAKEKESNKNKEGGVKGITASKDQNVTRPSTIFGATFSSSYRGSALLACVCAGRRKVKRPQSGTLEIRLTE